MDEVLVTGDVTHRGREDELAAFRTPFAPLRDRLVVVPGNHDRLGDDAARSLMPGWRVDVEIRPGLYVVRVDSTAPHNASSMLECHGELRADDLADLKRAVAAAPRGVLVVAMLHHHPLPLRGDHVVERLASWLELPHAAELARGPELVDLLLGRCDLVLHGHRHTPGELSRTSPGGRSLRILNAGATSEAGAARIVSHAGGRITSERWLAAPAPVSPPEPAPLAGADAGRAVAA